jgi:hypothetical protein
MSATEWDYDYTSVRARQSEGACTDDDVEDHDAANRDRERVPFLQQFVHWPGTHGRRFEKAKRTEELF